MQPQSGGAISVTVVIFLLKLAQTAHMGLCAPYRSIAACRMGFLVLLMETIGAALLISSQMEPSRASSNAVSVGGALL